MTQREIKFRAMRDDMNPSWVYGSLLYGGDIPHIQELPLFSLFTTCLKGTEGQFTGLQDKNGKDIYEGDVVRHTIEKAYDEVGEVVFADGYFQVKEYSSTLHFHNTGYINDPERPGDNGVEVIGNIYENPELLK